MTITMPTTTDTRARMIRAYRSGLEALIEDATQRPGDVRDEDTGELAMTLGDWDGVPVVTRKRLDEAISAIFGQSIPAPSETTVEVSTPATVLAFVGCPRCEIPSLISVSIHGELLTDDEGSELRAKPKSKPVHHLCGQLQMPESDEDSEDEQVGLMETIESLTERVHGMLTQIIETDEDHAPPSIEDVAGWDRATIDQVDEWATSTLAALAPGTHVIPPLPRVLGGEADPEPAEDSGEDIADPEAAERLNAFVDADNLDAENEAEEDLAPHPEDKGNGADEDDDLLPGEPLPAFMVDGPPVPCVRDDVTCVTHDATWPEVAKACWAVSPPPRKRAAS